MTARKGGACHGAHATRVPARSVRACGRSAGVRLRQPWCGITQLVRCYLDRNGVPYAYVDLDLHPEAAQRLR